MEQWQHDSLNFTQINYNLWEALILLNSFKIAVGKILYQKKLNLNLMHLLVEFKILRFQQPF
jgi:hypothetical protein